MTFEGGQVRDAIYVSGESPWPISAEEWEARAAETLEPGPFDYIAGGAGSEATMRANLAAFEQRRLRPRMLTGNSERDLSVEVLGTRSPAPFLLAPIGVLSIAHPEGELAVARAAAATGIPMVLSSAASHSIEEVAEAMEGAARGADTQDVRALPTRPSETAGRHEDQATGVPSRAPRWFQLYWVNDREVTLSLVQRAEAAGYSAIVVTLDTLTLGWRPRDLGRAYLPFITGEGCAQFFSDPVFRSRLERPPEQDVLAAAVTMLGRFGNLALTWEDLAWLRGQTPLPLLVKGVLTAEDAHRARECGVDGVVVSNHGGRQVDGAVAALDALVEVREALGPDAVVLMDSGIRCGADVLKALALGADAVLVGRPYAYGLAVGGQEGVETVLRHLLAETDLTLALVGGSRVADLDSSWIAASS
jgi:lactate 2-monooxygenase